MIIQIIESLQGMVIRKVCCGSQSTLVLTSGGKVYAWGCGPCLGMGSADATSAKPKLIEVLQPYCVLDISVGDSHCLALTQGKPPVYDLLSGVWMYRIYSCTSRMFRT